VLGLGIPELWQLRARPACGQQQVMLAEACMEPWWE
jgi:hypothetical protein